MNISADISRNLNLNEIIELDRKYYMKTFGERTPVCFSYGKGINLWDTEGRKFCDFLSGIAVNALGHSHPKLINAVKEQAEKIIHCSNLYYIEPQAKLAALLVENSCADRVFFANSGAEANEGAIKLARIYFRKKGMPEKYEIITMKNSFHGRTLATLAATGQEVYQKPFFPLPPGFRSVPLNDMDALKNAISEQTCAVMLEPIQGESGVHVADDSYIKAVRKLCDDNGILLIFDEIQCGMGRTGRLFAYEHYGVEPDIFTLAKALGGGVPIGALCAKEFVAQAFGKGEHGSTFGGNPLACAAGLAVLEALSEENLIENAQRQGRYFTEKLMELAEKHSSISEIRGKGLMIGVELNNCKAVAVKDSCFNSGYLIGSVGNNVLSFLPPLIVTKDDIDGMVNALDKALSQIEKE